ncbi:hypothetical protein RHO12_07345 [Orbus sturtevantii]|uniref:hypothetical protein n=1 Tax=Orbus sturtevantii TaxID=3074109 RepID=UPI00370DD7C9
MMKIMLRLTNIFILHLCLLSKNIYAESFETQSFSTEGAEVICDSKQNKSPLVINIYGETFSSIINITQNESNYFNVIAKFNYYNAPIYDDYKNILSVSYEFHIEDNKLVESTLIDQDLTQQTKDIFASIGNPP